VLCVGQEYSGEQGAAGWGAQRCAERCDKLPMARAWTETLVSALKLGARPFQSAAYSRPAILLYILYMHGTGALVPTALAMQLREHDVIDDLELLIAEMVRHQAHYHQCSLTEATRQLRALVVEAREEYRAAGAPYGDDDRGFCRSLLARPHLMPSASHDARPTT
jgi:hypothetical protein